MSGCEKCTLRRRGRLPTTISLITLTATLGIALPGGTISAETEPGQAAISSEGAPTQATTSGSVASGSEWAWSLNVDEQPTRAAVARPDVAALLQEMTRAMNGLQLRSRQPPYYVGYTLLDIEQRLVVGQLGAIVQSDNDHARSLRVEVRVGSPTIDNSHASHESNGFDFQSTGTALPLDDDLLALRTAIWSETDRAYREASEALEEKRASRASAVDYEQRPPDFAAHKPFVFTAEPERSLIASEQLQKVAKEVSQAFAPFPELHESAVTVAAWRIDRTLVTSEGTLVVTPTRVIEVTLECHTQAPDGMPLSHRKTVFGELDVDTLAQQAQLLGRQLTELRHAPLAPDYVGPVLFLGEAAPQIVLELLGQSLIGTPVPGEGPLSRRLKRRVLPTTFDLVDDPTLTHWHGQPLIGFYIADDEGVRAERVQLVDDGVLQTLLMSRTPSREISFSNGHGRTGYAGWARGSIGNLFLSTNDPKSLTALRRSLKQGAEPTLEIERLTPREFSSNGTTPPEVERAFSVAPDGKRTLVRGMILGEMQVRDLKDLSAGGSADTVYHALLNAGAYSIPVSVVSPPLLFEEVETKKAKRSPQLPKVLPRPHVAPP